MIAVDTNILVRFLTRDDEQQYQKAYRVFSNSERIFISATVILETEWVLRFSYHFSVEKIVYALSGLLSLNNVKVDNKEDVITALQWHRQGMDFADALHLVGSSHADTFVSFDKKMLKKSLSLNTGIRVIEP